ncbi:MAG: hypothetical protein HC831_16735 [Chloroflexia bacterium]|nr:hypothetical protein [Chloroflexia bacterium]
MGEKISSKTNVKQNSQARINELEAELNTYKVLAEQQKKMLTESEAIITQANLIKAQAEHYADSVKREANRKALSMINLTQNDTTTNKVTSAVEKSTKEITKEDFEKLAVDEKEFQNKQNIKKLQQRVKQLNAVQHKSSRDSLDLKQNRLSLRKELFDLAKYQLEIDRLKANTEEDKAKIEQREAQLLMMEQEIVFAEQELKNANDKIMLQNLEIKNKNIVLTSFIIGSFYF